MKLSRIICLMLFLLCLSISLATILSFEFAIAYGVLAVIASFVFLWNSTLKCPLLHGEYCFRLQSDVIKTFATASVSVFIGSLVYALALVLIYNADSESTFDSVLRFCFVLCLPFFLMIVEAAAIVAIKDAKVCSKMLGISKKSLQNLRRFFLLTFSGMLDIFIYNVNVIKT